MAYSAPGLSQFVIDDIPDLFIHPKAKVFRKSFIGEKIMCKLPGGQIFYDSKLDLDTDGSSTAAALDGTGQTSTSAKYSDGTNLDSDITNYFVMPGDFYPQHNIGFGDIAVVIYGIRVAFACFGDVGPKTKLGEGSISLHRELGHETFRGGKLINAGIDKDVITIVFPGSGNGFGISNSDCERIGRPLFQALLAEAASWARTLDGIELRRMGYEHDSLGISDDGWRKVRPGF